MDLIMKTLSYFMMEADMMDNIDRALIYAQTINLILFIAGIVAVLLY